MEDVKVKKTTTYDMAKSMIIFTLGFMLVVGLTVFPMECVVLTKTIFDVIPDVSKNTTDKVLSAAEALFPLAIIIDLIAYAFTRDPRKKEMEKAIAIGSVIGFILVIVIKNTSLVATIKALIPKSAGGTGNG